MTDHSGQERFSDKSVLLALCGLTPAVITETVWALAREGSCPERIVAITTAPGEDCLRSRLFASGLWDEFVEHLDRQGYSAPRFGPTREAVQVVAEHTGRADAVDLTRADGIAEFGDFVLGLLRQFTENDDIQVIFSLAGGRKTMSAIASQCMSLLARRHDRLVHVIVNAPYDDPRLAPRFFFPSARLHCSPDGLAVCGNDAVIQLHDVPFIRCRDLFRDTYDRLPGTFRDTVAYANRRIASARIFIELDLQAPGEPLLIINGAEIIPSRNKIAQVALYWLLCERRIQRQAPIDGLQNLLDEFHTFLGEPNSVISRKRLARMPSLIHVMGTLRTMDDSEDLSKIRSALDGSIAKAVSGAIRADVVTNAPGRGLYGLNVDPACIRIVTAAGDGG